MTYWFFKCRETPATIAAEPLQAHVVTDLRDSLQQREIRFLSDT
jgi:hypothetical protein